MARARGLVRRGVVIFAVVTTVGVSAACGDPAPPLGTEPEVRCGPVRPSECQELSRRILADVRVRFPDKQVELLEFSSADGGYVVHFTDGSGTGAQ